MLVQVHQHMANRLEGCDAGASELNIGGQDIKADGTSVSLRNVCDALHKAAEDHDATGALNLLEKLSLVTENSFSGEQCVDSVVAACGASSSVLEAKFGAQVSLKALQSMADLLHLFKEHNQSEDEPCQCPKRIDVVPMTKQILAVLGNSDPYLQAAGLEALQSIAEYLSDSQREWPAEDAFGAVGDLGVIESTISALKLLVSWDIHDSDRKEHVRLPSRVDLISKAFETLHFLCSQHTKNLCRLAAADGVPTLVSAAEVSLHPAYLLLLAQLALLDGVHSQHIQLCINVVLGSLNSKVEQLQCAALVALHQLHGDVAKPSVEAEADMLEQLLVQLLKQPRGTSSVAVQVHGLGLLARLAPSLPFAKQQLLITCMLMAVGNLCTQLSQTPNTVSVAPSMLASSTSLPIKVSKVQWKDVCNALISVMKFLSTAGSAGLNSTDDEGHTLLHRVAASGFSKALELVLSPPGMPAPDLLVRTREGNNALQLALRSGASECVALLEGATQAAAVQGIQHGVGSLAEGGRDAVPSQDQQELLLASPFASQSLSEGVPLLSQASSTYALGGASVSAAGVDTVSAAGEDTMNMYTRAVEARRAELEQHAAAAQRAQQATQSAPPCGGSHTRQLSDGKLSADSSRPHPPHSPQPQEGGPMLSAFAETGTAAPHQTAFSISGLDLSQAVGAGLSPSVAPPPLPAGIPLDQPSMQHPHPTPPQGSPHLTGVSAFAAAQGGPAFDSPHATPTVAPPLSLSGTTPSILSFPGDAAMHRGSSLSSQLQDSLFIYPQDGPGSPLPNGSMCSSLAVAAAATQLQRAASATSAAAARIPLQQARRAGSAASEILQLLPSTAAGQESAAELALGMQAMGGLAGAVADEPEAGSCGDKAKDMDSDVSGEPTRHLWIGNLGTRTPRTVLKTFFDKFGTVDDVVTFPGRMYAFVNYRTLEESMAAFAAMQSQVVPELTGERPLLLKYRPAKKAAAHLRALGLAIEDGNGAGGEGPKAGTSVPEGVAGAGATQGEAVDKDGNSLDPSPRIWLGNIAPTATSKSLHTVLSRFGILNDAAVFPARIGPLGYAFVKFERLEDAIQAFDTLNNTVVPPLSGSKQLKMRYKPPSEGPAGKDDVLEGAKLMVPSRHLWLGNVTQKPSDEAVLEVFSAFGKVDSVRVFPVKAYAFVNYAEIACAIKAMTALEGVAIPSLTGVKPLVMRYQQEAVVAAATAAAAPKPGAAPLPPGMEGMGGLAGESAPTSHLGVASGLLPEDVAQAVPNLSNMLNPNNLHFDPVLAERYKALSRREKDLLWAKDQLMMAHQLAAAQQAAASGATPADLHMMMRGMNRSHSWNISMLHNHLTQHPNQPASGLSPALTAAAALAALQQQQHAQQAEQQRQLAALQLLNNPGEGQGGGVSRQSSQSLGTVTPQQAQQVLSMQSSRTLTPKPQHPSAPPTSTSASPAQLSAVLSNLAALQSMHSAQEAAGAGRVQPHLEAGLPASMQRAASLPHPRVHSHPPGAPFSGLDAGVLLDTYLGRGSGEGGEQQHHQQQQLDVLSGLVPPPSPPQGSLSGSLDISDFLAKQGLTGGAPASSPRGADGMASALARYGSGNQTPSLSSSAFSPVNLPALSAPAASPAMSSAGSWAAQHIPQHLLCPLSGQVMLDPVVAADGVTYERKAISDWMALRGTSPTTGAPLLHKMLTPSMPTKAALMDYLQRSQLGGGL